MSSPLPTTRFRYGLDPLCLAGCVLYAVNRWLIKPHVSLEFIQYHFNDLWVIPCALPWVLWLHRQLGLRPTDAPPQPGEIVFHLVMWSVICEVVGPRFVTSAGSDYRDILAYSAGAFAAGVWWQRHRWLSHHAAPDTGMPAHVHAHGDTRS
ncbi:MAG: hypothetical protein ACAI34_09550 [Verrucomicrobium sp.]|nr:hypothetical protein [Verrucomicrobium sp.]